MLRLSMCIFLLICEFPIANVVLGFDGLREHYFGTKPVPCKGYLAMKHHAEKSGSYKKDSFFLAKVQIVGSSLKQEKTINRAVMVEIVERLEGSVPAEQFVVKYRGRTDELGMASDLAEEKSYFVMGCIIEGEMFKWSGWKEGDILLAPIPFQEMQTDGWWEPFLRWFPAGWVTDCENVR